MKQGKQFLLNLVATTFYYGVLAVSVVVCVSWGNISRAGLPFLQIGLGVCLVIIIISIIKAFISGRIYSLSKYGGNLGLTYKETSSKRFYGELIIRLIFGSVVALAFLSIILK